MVLVATDEREPLCAALESLFADEHVVGLEVVVVDNASSDGSAEEVAARWPRARVIRRSRRFGLSANVNVGIAATDAPLVMMCNSDVVFRPGVITRLTDLFGEHPQMGLASPGLVSAEGDTWPSARRWYTPGALAILRLPWVRDPAHYPCVRRHLYLDRDQATPRSVDWVLCAAAMVRRAALDDVGLMDKRFRIYFGDVDLALRLHHAGWEVWSVPDVQMVHHWRRASRRPLSRAWFSHLRALLSFAWKHRGLRPKQATPRILGRTHRPVPLGGVTAVCGKGRQPTGGGRPPEKNDG